MADQLSEVFELVEVRSIVSGGFVARGPWVTRFPLESPLKLMALVSGSARLMTDGIDTPIELAPGDVAILNHRSWAVLESSQSGLATEFMLDESEPFLYVGGAPYEGSDVVIGGHIDVNRAGEDLLVKALPPVGHVRAAAAEASSLHAILDRLVDEVIGRRIGAAFAMHQYSQLLLVHLLRAFVAQADELPPGWLRVLTDERLRPALQLMHGEPGRSWRLDELARAAAMSRTSFAERFRTVAGVPPLTYLNNWRMLLAQRALRDPDARVGLLAHELGYSSESAFSNAFKREVGLSPLRYRARVRDEMSAAAQ